MNKRVIFLSLVCFLVASVSYAETPGEMARQAEQYYNLGEYRLAIQEWKELSSLGFVNGHLLSNIASAYWRLGEVGQARLYFLKAKSWDPRDTDIRSNLAFIKNKLGESKSEEGLTYLLSRIPWWKASLNFQQSLQVTALLSLLIFLILIRARVKKLNFPQVVIWALVPLTIFSGGQLIYQFYRLHWENNSVVLKRQVSLLTAPSTESPSTTLLKEGSRVTVKKKQGNDRLIKTSSGKRGWVQSDQIGEI